MDINDHWVKIKEVVNSTCADKLGPKKRVHKDWVTTDSLEKIRIRREIKEQINASRTEEEKRIAKEKYSNAHRDVKNSLKKDKNAYMEELAEKAEQVAANGHMRIVYQTTRVLSGKFSKPTVPVKDAQGEPIFEQKGQTERWREHFESLLNRPPPEKPPDLLPARRDLPIDTEPPTERRN